MRAGTCKHFNGDVHNTHCRAGVCFASVTSGTKEEPGWAFRKPCIDWSRRELSPGQAEEWARRGACVKREEPTAAEIEAFEVEMNLAMERMTAAVVPLVIALKAEFKGQSWRGVRECPVCHGRLHLSHAGCNGHVRGRCETKDCLAWME